MYSDSDDRRLLHRMIFWQNLERIKTKDEIEHKRNTIQAFLFDLCIKLPKNEVISIFYLSIRTCIVTN